MQGKKKQVVFSEPYSSVMIYKIAKLLREKGYETVLIRFLEQNKQDNDFYNQAFDRVINFNIPHNTISRSGLMKQALPIFLNQLKRSIKYLRCIFEIKRLRPYVYIGRGKSNWPIAFLRMFILRDTPFIYFPYDIRNNLATSYNKNVPYFELWSERYCFENSDGIIHKGAPQELDPKTMNNRSIGNGLLIQPLQLNFYPYCSKEFFVPLNKNKISKKDKEMHLVYVGGIKKPSVEYFQSLYVMLDFLFRQKVHIHFYFCSDTKEKKDTDKELASLDAFLGQNKQDPYIKYFHFHDSVDPIDLPKVISVYDFAIQGGVPDIYTDALEPIYTLGNKVATYLEAGLPFFYSREYAFMHKIMSSYGLDLSYPDDEKDNIIKKIKRLNYKVLQKNVLKAREDFLMEKHIDEFIAFIEKVNVSKKK